MRPHTGLLLLRTVAPPPQHPLTLSPSSQPSSVPLASTSYLLQVHILIFIRENPNNEPVKVQLDRNAKISGGASGGRGPVKVLFRLEFKARVKIKMCTCTPTSSLHRSPTPSETLHCEESDCKCMPSSSVSGFQRVFGLVGR